MEASPKMKKAIKNIELGLGIKYHGKTFEDAQNFLEENLPKLKDVDMRDKWKPTKKMMDGIAFCEKVLGVKFVGSTSKDASEFLEKYLQKTLDTVNANNKGSYKPKKRRK